MQVRQFNPDRDRKRWFSYFDLLGFRKLVSSNDMGDVIDAYNAVLALLERQVKPKKSRGMLHSWFSDTFILYSKDDSVHEFAMLESVAHTFFESLIIRHIPVRGAIATGHLYSQQKQNVFVGRALIDAYDYAEDQNWIGLILTPEVCHKLSGTELDLAKRPFYRPVPPTGIMRCKPSQDVYAFAFNRGQVQGKNAYLDHVREMRNAAGPKHERKYINTEAFILEHDESGHWPQAGEP